MKKKVLPLAVGTATAVVMSAANAAMYVNDKGMGETLIFPFYSAENGNSTNVNIANTTTGTKAVKVRILEAQNSREVLDFNLYLSPKDHFSFAVLADAADGGGMLKTNDNSCTVPAIPSDGVKFRDFLYNPADSAEDDADTETVDESYDNTSITRTAVGYIEVIEMGQIDPDATPVLDTATTGAINAAAAIKHDSDGVPANCALLTAAWSTASDGTAGKWLAESLGLGDGVGFSEFLDDWAGGGLYGYASVINVDQGAAFGYDAIAVADHVADGAAGFAMHYEPGSINPNFTDASFDNVAIVNDGGAAITVAFDDAEYAPGVDSVQALNATMMAVAVHNDYVTDPGLSATTDWVLTFPTKAFHVNGTEPVEPFSELWSGQSACEYAAMDMTDREESTAPPIVPPDQSGGPDFSPKPPPGPSPADPENGDLKLCYESTIVQFADESAAGTSTVAVGVSEFLDAADGWGTISFDPDDLFDGGSDLGICGQDANGLTTADQDVPCDRKIDSNGHTMTGLPVVGFAVQKYVNGQLGSGVLANYAVSTVHKTTIAISADQP